MPSIQIHDRPWAKILGECLMQVWQIDFRWMGASPKLDCAMRELCHLPLVALTGDTPNSPVCGLHL